MKHVIETSLRAKSFKSLVYQLILLLVMVRVVFLLQSKNKISGKLVQAFFSHCRELLLDTASLIWSLLLISHQIENAAILVKTHHLV